MTWLIALSLLTILTYAPTLRYGFVYDDTNWVHWAPTIEDAPAWQYVARFPWTFATWLGGGLPWAFHAVVVTLHLVNGWLLWALSRRWLSVSASLLCLTLFWLHPIQTEAVAYVSGGIEVLLTTYVLLAILGGLSDSWTLTALGGISLFLVATLKLSALPALLVVPAVLWLAKPRQSAIVWSVALSSLYVLGIPAVIVWGIGHRASLLTRVHGLNMVLLETWRYLALIVWPQGFSVEHTFNPSVAWIAGLASLAIGLIVWSIRSWRAPLLAYCWIAGWLLPRGLASYHGSPLTEKHTYVLFLALWLLAGSALDHFVLKGQLNGKPASA